MARGGVPLHPLLGVALAAAMAQLAAGDDAPFSAPESLSPGVLYCDQLWDALTGDCNPCETLGRALRRVGGPPLVCPE